MATNNASSYPVPQRSTPRISRVGWLLRGLLTLAMIGQLLGLPGVVALAAPPVTSIVVTTTGDTFDAGACATVGLGDLPGPDNEVTLREAICVSNNTAGDETITFGGITGTISPASELLITGGLTILGAGAANMTISGGNAHRVFNISGGGTVTISDLTIANGSTDEGGGIYMLDGTVTLTNVTVSSNAASGRGGGIYHYSGTLSLIDTLVTGNTAYYSGGIHTYTGTLNLTRSAVDSNTAVASGGIGNSSATVSLTDSTVSNNTATVYAIDAGGGGITTQGPLTLTNSTVSNNVSLAGDGGGLYIVDGTGAITVSLIGSTISGNSAYDRGGGIAVYGRAGGQPITLTLTNGSIVSANTAGFGGGIDNYSEGGEATVSLTDSQVSENTAESGGGITNSMLYSDQAIVTAKVLLVRSTVEKNTATSAGGGLYNVTQPSSSVDLVGIDLEATNLVENTAGRGGGLYNISGSVRMNASLVDGNSATEWGGGIGTYDHLILTGTTVQDNRAPQGGGIRAEYATVTIGESTISSNLAKPLAAPATSDAGPASVEPLGGGIYSVYSTITLTDTTVRSNQALYWPGFGQPKTGSGGGIYASGGRVGIYRSTISANWANNGAGIYSTNGNTLDALNSTISSNHAYANGGGVFSDNSTASLDFVTVVLNDADYDGDYVGGLGYGLYLHHTNGLTATTSPAQGAVFSIARSIVAGNKYTGVGYEECYAIGASFTSNGHNLFGDSLYGQDCPAGPSDLILPAETSIYTVVGSLADNGGPTDTHALMTDSVALDAIPCESGALGDQRGVSRPQGEGCDIGAFELETATPSPSPSPSASPSPSPTVTLTVTVAGSGAVEVSPPPPGNGLSPQSGQVYHYPTGTVVTLTATPGAGSLLAHWVVDGTTQPPYGNGWANPLTVTLDTSHTVAATFAMRPTFSDLPPGTLAYGPATELAARGIIKGYDPQGCAGLGVAYPCYGSTDQTERAQVATFLARLLGVAGEDHGNGGFTDLAGLPPDMQRAVGTLAHYGIMIGYGDGRFGPFNKITHTETILVISRAMVFQGYWTRATQDNPAIYPNLNLIPAARLDLVTFVQNAGNLPSFANDTPRWLIDLPAVRVWTAQALWQALDTYFGVDESGKGGYVP